MLYFLSTNILCRNIKIFIFLIDETRDTFNGNKKQNNETGVVVSCSFFTSKNIVNIDLNYKVSGRFKFFFFFQNAYHEIKNGRFF